MSAAGQVRLGLVVVEVADEVLDLVLREELAELGVELRGERLVVGEDERRAVGLLDDLGERVGLARPRRAEQDLVVEALAEAVDQALDRLGLVARRFERGDEFEVRHVMPILPVKHEPNKCSYPSPSRSVDNRDPTGLSVPDRTPSSPEDLLTSTLDDIAIRPLAGPDELPLFLQLSYVLDHELADDLATERRRPEWMWVALRGDRLVGRLAWWARPGGRHPEALDYFDLDDSLDDPERTDIGARLLATAQANVIGSAAEWPEYIRFIPPDWRDDPVARRVVDGRMTVLERSGARLLVERIRLEWRPGTLIPEPTGRLRFRRVASRAELLELMARDPGGHP